MSYRSVITNTARKRMIALFKVMSRGRGADKLLYKPQDITLNQYHDVIDSIKKDTIRVDCFVAKESPTKVLKMLNWWREDDSKPILVYMPYVDGIDPTQWDQFTIVNDEGYNKGTYKVTQVKQFGDDLPIVWVFNVTNAKADPPAIC